MALPLSKLFVRAPVVPVVRLIGIIGADGTPFRPGLSLARVEAPLEAAFSMKKAAAVAVVINSPGGSPVQSRLIHDRIRQLADRHGRKVLVFCEDVAASGGYMIAVAGDEIFVDAASVVGSIGVISQGFGLKGLIDRLGVERRVHTAGTRKAILDPFSPERPEDVAHLEALQAKAMPASSRWCGSVAAAGWPRIRICSPACSGPAPAPFPSAWPMASAIPGRCWKSAMARMWC